MAHVVAYGPNVELGGPEDGVQRAACGRNFPPHLRLVLLRQVNHLLRAPRHTVSQLVPAALCVDCDAVSLQAFRSRDADQEESTSHAEVMRCL